MHHSHRTGLWCGLLMLLASSIVIPCRAEEKPQTAPKNVAKEESKPPSVPVKKLVSGKVVFLAEALKRRGIPSFEEQAKLVVLETATGELHPIVADWRGRAFFQDKQLRNRPVELIVQKHEGVPYLQVLTIYTFDPKAKGENQQRLYTDYWCDICSIPMYEIKPCDCCQGPIELRFQPKDLPDYIQSPETQSDQTTSDEKPSADQ